MKQVVDKMDNKAISAVVATVMIILITVAAVTIVWVTILPMVRDQLQGSNCFDAQARVILKTDMGKTCYVDNGDDTWDLKIQIANTGNSYTLKDVQVSLEKEGNSEAYFLSEVVENFENIGMPGQNEERVFTLSGGVNGLSNLKGYNIVEIAPIVEVNEDTEKCGISSESVLKECA